MLNQSARNKSEVPDHLENLFTNPAPVNAKGKPIDSYGDRSVKRNAKTIYPPTDHSDHSQDFPHSQATD